MAELDRGAGNTGFTDKRRTQATTGAQVATPANYASASALRTRLAAIDGTYYSAARLNQMTHNDLIHALRLNDDAAGI